jgi:hypothetical protein
MKPFHDKFMAKWNESFVAPLERDLGVKLADFADLPQGQFTFAVTQNGWNGNDKTPGMVLLLDAEGQKRFAQNQPRRAPKKMDGRRQADPHGNHPRHFLFRRAAFEQ